MEIINVIEIVKGVLTHIFSFPVQEDASNEARQIDAAETLFLKLAKENGYEGENKYILDDGNWDNENGYEVLISWSDVRF